MPEKRKILICLATLMWQKDNDDYIPGTDKFILISDESHDSDCFSNPECRSLKAIVEHSIVNGYDIRGPFSKDDPKPEVVFDLSERSYISYSDGYFGRPLIPAKVYRLDPLKPKQIKEVEEVLAEAEKAISE